MNLLLISFILVAAFVAIMLSDKLGIPSIILFIAMGMVFSHNGFVIEDFDYAIDLASLALIIITFYSGFAIKWDWVKSSAKESLLLSTLGSIITAVSIGVFTHFVFGFKLMEGILLGAVVCSTDAAGIFSILKRKKLDFKYDTTAIIQLESGANDTFSKSMTFAFIATIGSNVNKMPLVLLQLLIVGGIVGFVFAYIARLLIRNNILKNQVLANDGMFTIFLITLMLLTYSIADKLGGNGFVSVYILGLALGNIEFAGKSEQVVVFEGVTSILQIGFFFMLGVYSETAKFFAYLPTALAITLFIVLVARPLAVNAILIPFKRPREQINLLSFVGFRGSTAIILALKCAHIPLGFELLHIVFGIVVLSYLIKTAFLSPLSRFLDMEDPSHSIQKSFNDYSQAMNIGFLKTQVAGDSSLVGKEIKDIPSNFDFLITQIERDKKHIIPKGDTTIQEGDTIVVSGQVYKDDFNILNELVIYDKHKWANKKLKEIDFGPNTLIIVIIRGNNIITPHGDTVLLPDDRIVLSKKDN